MPTSLSKDSEAPEMLICPKCTRKVQLRKDGRIPLHTTDTPRVFRYRTKALKYVHGCPAGGTIPSRWSRK